ncbi:hypothetical protein CCHL11_09709 [Colletotrichum chlorophyti]|uniref:Uncharacterized protein n=1 Tax=Colletotrichum chlorophyti TaxID=708187 RepID=A0A1Q8R9Q7_9PEZI|nr:hypothetical protein CCHL11_09709 [Colletotrichum chlorophyti]
MAPSKAAKAQNSEAIDMARPLGHEERRMLIRAVDRFVKKREQVEGQMTKAIKRLDRSNDAQVQQEELLQMSLRNKSREKKFIRRQSKVLCEREKLYKMDPSDARAQDVELLKAILSKLSTNSPNKKENRKFQLKGSDDFSYVNPGTACEKLDGDENDYHSALDIDLGARPSVPKAEDDAEKPWETNKEKRKRDAEPPQPCKKMKNGLVSQEILQSTLGAIHHGQPRLLTKGEEEIDVEETYEDEQKNKKTKKVKKSNPFPSAVGQPERNNDIEVDFTCVSEETKKRKKAHSDSTGKINMKAKEKRGHKKKCREKSELPSFDRAAKHLEDRGSTPISSLETSKDKKPKPELACKLAGDVEKTKKLTKKEKNRDKQPDCSSAKPIVDEQERQEETQSSSDINHKEFDEARKAVEDILSSGGVVTKDMKKNVHPLRVAAEEQHANTNDKTKTKTTNRQEKTSAQHTIGKTSKFEQNEKYNTPVISKERTSLPAKSIPLGPAFVIPSTTIAVPKLATTDQVPNKVNSLSSVKPVIKGPTRINTPATSAISRLVNAGRTPFNPWQGLRSFSTQNPEPIHVCEDNMERVEKSPKQKHTQKWVLDATGSRKKTKGSDTDVKKITMSIGKVTTPHKMDQGSPTPLPKKEVRKRGRPKKAKKSVAAGELRDSTHPGQTPVSHIGASDDLVRVITPPAAAIMIGGFSARSQALRENDKKVLEEEKRRWYEALNLEPME